MHLGVRSVSEQKVIEIKDVLEHLGIDLEKWIRYEEQYRMESEAAEQNRDGKDGSGR